MIFLVFTRRCKRGPTSPDHDLAQPVVASVAVARESTAGIRNRCEDRVDAEIFHITKPSIEQILEANDHHLPVKRSHFSLPGKSVQDKVVAGSGEAAVLVVRERDR
jgi:hypothetical protein